MSWRDRLDRRVQAREDSAVQLSSAPTPFSKSHLSFSPNHEPEPEHPSKNVDYGRVLSKSDLDKLLSSGETYRRDRD